ncbi:DUF3311 domain-containing protein [Streptomyces sp. LZ34]
MSGTTGTQGRRPVVTPSRVVAGLCLIAPFVAMLWVDSYAKIEPTWIGIPFFYWYQMLWVPVSAVLTSVAYILVRREKRALREAERTQKGGAAE